MLRFNIQNGDSPFVEHVHINIKTWFGEANWDPWKNIQSSGAYIFNPAHGQFDALPYTKLHSYTKLSDDTFQFVMGKLNDEQEFSNNANITV